MSVVMDIRTVCLLAEVSRISLFIRSSIVSDSISIVSLKLRSYP